MNYTAGKNLTTADALSRAPVGSPQAADLLLERDATAFVQSLISGLPAAQGRLESDATAFVQSVIDGLPATKGRLESDATAFVQSLIDGLSATQGRLESDATAFVQSLIDGLPATRGRLVDIKTKQQEDQVCSQVAYYCREGWPADKSKIDPDIRPFFTVRDDLIVQEGLLLYRTRLVIPVELRRDILSKIHDGHQGIVKCRALAKCSVWWPGLSQQIQSMVENCNL